MSNTNKFVGIFFLVSILIILIYRANEGFDIIAPQFFFLSILSSFYFFYQIFRNKKIIFNEKYIVPSLFLGIISYGLFTSLWAYNKPEVFITSGQFFTAYLIIYSFISLPSDKIFNSFVGFFVIIFLLIENFWSLSIIYQYFLEDGYTGRNLYFSGMSANPNITAFSISLKLAIIPLFIEKLTYKNLLKTVYGLLIFSSTLLILFLGSRGGFIAIFLALAGIIISDLKNKNFKNLTIKIFLISLSFISFNLLDGGTNDLIDKVSSINPNTKDGSIDSRLRYYKHSIDLFKENPFGIGFGNWKIESISKDKNNLIDFIIPYHSHNDFLEILSELGFFGVLYISVYVLILLTLFNKILNNYRYVFLLIGVIIFIIDSNLNFPIYRPIMLINLSLLLYFTYNYEC